MPHLALLVVRWHYLLYCAGCQEKEEVGGGMCREQRSASRGMALAVVEDREGVHIRIEKEEVLMEERIVNAREEARRAERIRHD